MSGSGTAASSTTDILPGTISLDDTAGTGVGTADGSATGLDSTGTDTGFETDSDTDSDTDGTDTGEPVEPGRAGGAFVNAGGHDLMSAGYRLLFTFGQASQNQTTMTSASYRLQGGLVPATQ